MEFLKKTIGIDGVQITVGALIIVLVLVWLLFLRK